MRIIHTDTDDIENPLRGGQPVRTFEINTRLAKNHQITVLTSTYKDSKKQVLRNNIAYERLGVTIPRWGLSSHLSYLARLPKAIKTKPHDLVLEEFTPPFGFCNLQDFTDKPVVSMVQWFFFKDWEKRYKLPFEAMMRKRAQRYPERHIIVQTNTMGDYFKALLPRSHIYKIPCGINADAIHESRQVGDYALYLGRLDIQHKGLDDLLLAWKLLISQGIAIPLWIVGAGQDETELKKRVRAYGLEQVVLFKGRIEGAAKQQVLQACRFLVMPSRQETFGLTALEAMACSKPVIAYDIDHLNELMHPSWSALVKLGDINALSQAVARHWQDTELCRQKGLAALQNAKTYLWDNVAQAQQDLYTEIVKQKNENRIISTLDIPSRGP